MKALRRKLLRELWGARGQLLAIALLVACAVATFVGAMGTWRALERAQAAYYAGYAFPHVFAECRRAPEPVARRAALLPGVAEVETRVGAQVTLEVPGLGEPASALLTSLPDDGAPRLSRLHLRSGRSLAPDRAGEVLVSESFAQANHLAQGARLVAVINGRRQALTVVGVALSPEHLFVLAPGAFVPDDRHFGVLWMARTPLATALDLKDAFSSIAVRLAPGAPSGPVLAGLDRLLAPWGGQGAYERARHPSHRYVSDEIAQLRALATLIPAIFLGVAAFLVGVALSRLVALQRTHLGTLKALGYGDLRLALHYAGFPLLTVLPGAAAGSAGGFLMGAGLARVYARYYRFPALRYTLDLDVVALATALALAAALAGAAGAIRRAARLPPAAAMRPEAPPTYRPSALERLGLGRHLSPAGRMVLRDLGRRPLRTALSCAGMATAVGVMVVASFMRDATHLLVTQQFDVAAREDVTVGFTQVVRSADALRELRALPGVTAAEGWRAVPVSLRAGHRSYRTALVGLAPGASLHRVVDGGGRAVPVPPRGLLLSLRLAETLGVAPGDALRVELLEGTRAAADLPVAATVDDLLGVQATLAAPALARLAGDGELVTGAWLAIDPARQDALLARLRAAPRVASVALRGPTLASLAKMIDDSLLWFTTLLGFFAVVIAAGVVYNAARVALAERERELATLRVVGFTVGETWRVVAGAVGAQLLLAVPLGWLVGAGFVGLTARATASELMRLPALVTRGNCAAAALVVLAAAGAVALHARRWLARLDLVAVLKAKE
ncbi:ABC transporter permease [Anaeromyxobacter diazotrophicus]|uniref:Peptide ABC transporter permease n=1 Tax=Anaeromyxobacter diazotrophicus TaxID=2590199 RepID=A0A7I9VNU9_9BACT|nr:ABC transporter permease [Anaeromyxobacter diazotrophicus]GEJ58083.1 peptide ABC transporter permease [Anaeromyxobacter diazotrophicus]